MKDKFLFEYTPNMADANYGFSLAFFGTPAKAARTLFMFLLLPASAIYLLISSAMRGGSWLDYALMSLVASGLWLSCFYLSMRAWLTRTVLKRQLADGSNQTIHVDKESIERKTRGRQSSISWSEISSYQELDRVFAFYKSKRLVAGIEKSAIPSLTELDEFRGFLRDVIGLKTRANR